MERGADVTICICTRNRAHLLGGILGDLRAQARNAARAWELLVVDNGSTDGTPDVVRSAEGELPLRYLREPRAGLSVARNLALRECRAPVAVFTDDDVRLGEGWLEAWIAAARAGGPYGWYGGTVRPSWPEARPAWLQDEGLDLLSGVLGRHLLSGDVRPYRAEDPLPIGANFAVRMTAVAAIGDFREDLGVRDRERGRGEETDWFLRARRSGLTGLHVGTAVVLHPVQPDRLSFPALWEHGVASGIAHARIEPSAPRGSWLRAAGFLARGARQWLIGHGDRLRQCVINAGIQVGLQREQTRVERSARDRRGPGG